MNTDTPVERAYADSNYNLVEVGPNTLPVATPAVFTYEDELGKVMADGVLDALDEDAHDPDHDVATQVFVAPYTQMGEEIGQVYVSSTVLDTETNESFKLKITANVVCVYPSEEFSEETLRRIVELVEQRLDVTLAYDGDSDTGGEP